MNEFKSIYISSGHFLHDEFKKNDCSNMYTLHLRKWLNLENDYPRLKFPAFLQSNKEKFGRGGEGGRHLVVSLALMATLNTEQKPH